MRVWFHDLIVAIQTVARGIYITLWYFLQTYRRKTFTERSFLITKPRWRGGSLDDGMDGRTV